MNRGSLFATYAVVILVIWAAAFIDGVVTGDWAALATCTTVLLAIIGIFGMVRKGTNGETPPK